MADTKRTIYQVLKSKDSAKLALAELDKLNAVLSNPAHEKCAELTKAMAEATGNNVNPAYAVSTAREVVSEYINLVDAVLNETKIPWPPAATGG